MFWGAEGWIIECGDSEGCSVCVCLNIPPCMHKRVEACVCVRCPSVVMVDDHMCLMGWDMTEMGTKWNMMMRMKNHAHCVCTILHVHKVRVGDVFV